MSGEGGTESERLLQIFSKDHGPSVAGISHYSAAYSCARKVRLNQATKALDVLEAEEGVEGAGDSPMETKPVATKVGTFYHLLMEELCRGTFTQDFLSVPYSTYAHSGTFTLSQLEALRLFRGWCQRWVSPQDKYGFPMTLIEHGIGDTEGEVTKRLGAPLTGRLDAGGTADLSACAQIFASTGVLLEGPGVVGIDWKSSSTMSKGDKDIYELGLQGMAYLWMYNVKAEQEGTEPMKCLIFDKIARHKMIEDKSFGHYVVYPHPHAEEILRNYVQGVQGPLEGEGLANPGNCVDWRTGRTCYFLNTCNRY